MTRSECMLFVDISTSSPASSLCSRWSLSRGELSRSQSGGRDATDGRHPRGGRPVQPGARLAGNSSLGLHARTRRCSSSVGSAPCGVHNALFFCRHPCIENAAIALLAVGSALRPFSGDPGPRETTMPPRCPEPRCSGRGREPHHHLVCYGYRCADCDAFAGSV